MHMSGWTSAVRHRIGHTWRSVRLVGAVAPAWTIGWAALLVVQGLLPVAFVYLSKLLVDRLTDTVGGALTWATVAPVLTIAAAMAGLLLLTEIAQVSLGWLRTAQAELVQDHIRRMVHERSTTLDLACYESPKYHDRMHRARHEAAHRPIALLEGGGTLLQGTVTLVGMASLVLPYGPWVPVALMVSAIPAAYAVARNSRRYHRWWHQSTPTRRWTNYYDWLLTFSDFAAELRQYDVGQHFATMYQALRRRLRRQRVRLLKRETMTGLGASIASLLISGAAIGWMVWRTLAGLATLGDLVLFHQAFERGRKALRGWLSSAGQLYGDSLVVGSLFEFLDLVPHVVDPPSPQPVPRTLAHGVTFDRITFCYPDSARPALEDFTLELPAGEIAALVGPNGAGKSTVLKLLCRFYDPQRGRIALDGIDLRHFRLRDVRRSLTVAFQRPVPYHATLHENIALGDLETEATRAVVEAAATAGGAAEVAARLPRGYDTLLSKWFAGGTDLSTGEWQRVALARSLLRRAPIVVLDEPTSAMDPWAEAAWMERLRALVEHRTVLLITHRLGVALRADVVHVMDHGRLVRSVRTRSDGKSGGAARTPDASQDGIRAALGI